MEHCDDQLIVVTGGAGFIGSGVIRYLNDRGCDNIVVVDSLGTDDKWKNLVGKRFVDIIEIQDFFEWLEGREDEIGAFIHLGACSSTVEKDAGFLLENNYRFSVRLAERALKNGQRLIYASSGATYGSGEQGFSDDEAALEELRPINMYGYSKHLFDLWAKRQGVLDRIVGLKYFNVFGPNEWHKGRMASLVYHVTPVAEREGVIRLFKSSDPDHFPDGGQMRDFIFVKDAVKVTCSFLENEIGGIYNVGRGVAESWNSLAKAIFKGIRKEPKIEYIPMPQDLVGKYQNYTCADTEKLHRALKPEQYGCATLDASVEDYIQNHLLTGKPW